MGQFIRWVKITSIKKFQVISVLFDYLCAFIQFLFDLFTYSFYLLYNSLYYSVLYSDCFIRSM
jgi:hypothetical protein